MALEWSSLQNLRLEPHPNVQARDRAISTKNLVSGTVILSVPALSSVLLPPEKGRRCDECHRLGSGTVQLQKCSGCASYWYCGTECQSRQWKSHHKMLCKAYNRYIASKEYQALLPHEKLDAILLSHLAAEFVLVSSSIPPTTEAPFATLLSLLPGPISNLKAPSLCISVGNFSPDMLDAIYSRFGNNNFAVHSHLVSFAHGIFPLASRLFNHSCLPNAAARYILTPMNRIRMEVFALSDIPQGTEVCIPYLDPALSQSRRQIFEFTYGFQCACPSCSFLLRVSPIPNPPSTTGECTELEDQLRRFVFTGSNPAAALCCPKDLDYYERIPRTLLPFFHEKYLTILSEKFSEASHGGPYDIALDVGLTILAIYALVYPCNYPQTGMHLLEMAKTAWNALITNKADGLYTELLGKLRRYLALSHKVLKVFGQEGDSGGPLDEIQILQTLLNSELNRSS